MKKGLNRKHLSCQKVDCSTKTCSNTKKTCFKESIKPLSLPNTHPSNIDDIIDETKSGNPELE